MTFLIKVNSISATGKGTEKIVLPLAEQSPLHEIADIRLVKFNSDIPENKTPVARDAEKATYNLGSKVSR